MRYFGCSDGMRWGFSVRCRSATWRCPSYKSNEKRARTPFRSECSSDESNSCRRIAIWGLDAHASFCILAAVNARGQPLRSRSFATSEAALIREVRSFRAKHKLLGLEESSLAGWIAGALRPYVDKLIVCDPRHNALISRGGNEDDISDAFKLCRRLRMGELVPVYHTRHQHRADFMIAAQQYLTVRADAASLKTQIKAKFRQAGVIQVTGTEVFSKTHRDRFLKQVRSKARREIIGRLYELSRTLSCRRPRPRWWN